MQARRNKNHVVYCTFKSSTTPFRYTFKERIEKSRTRFCFIKFELIIARLCLPYVKLYVDCIVDLKIGSGHYTTFYVPAT